MKTLRYEFQTDSGFLYDSRETLTDAKLHAIGLANDLKRTVSVIAIMSDGVSHNRLRCVAKYKPTVK